MKVVILNKNGQISLVSFLSILVIQPILLMLANFKIAPVALTVIAYLLTFPLLIISVFFGIKQLRKTKFPLFWIVPALSYFLIFLVATCYSVTNITKYNPPKRKIGVALKDLPDGKIQIISVYYKSPAEKAGIKNGDIITRIKDEVIDKETIKDVVDLIGSSYDPLAIEIERNGEKKIFNIDNTANEDTPLDQNSAPASAKATADRPRKSGK